MTLGANAFLVGLNNAGKSTLIEAAGVCARIRSAGISTAW